MTGRTDLNLKLFPRSLKSGNIKDISQLHWLLGVSFYQAICG